MRTKQWLCGSLLMSLVGCAATSSSAMKEETYHNWTLSEHNSVSTQGHQYVLSLTEAGNGSNFQVLCDDAGLSVNIETETNTGWYNSAFAQITIDDQPMFVINTFKGDSTGKGASTSESQDVQKIVNALRSGEKMESRLVGSLGISQDQFEIIGAKDALHALSQKCSYARL